MAYPPQSANMPSRTGPVVLIVLGALAMILGPIIGIIAGVSGILGSLNLEDYADAQQVTNGSAASLSGNAEFLVAPSSGTTGYSCDVTGPGGQAVDTTSRDGIITFFTDEAGPYTITCDPSGGTLVILPAGDVDELISSAPGAATAMIVGFVAGFVGLVALVVGIIWLVRVNKDRKTATFGGGYPPGGYGQGGYQGGQPGGQQQWGSGPYQTPPAGQAGQQPWTGGQYVPPPAGQAPPSSPPWQGGGAPTYGAQSPTDPPRYGERIEPQDPKPPA